LRCGDLSTVSRLRTYLEKLADLLSNMGIDSSRLRESVSRLRSLEKAFIIVKPFAQGVSEIANCIKSIEALTQLSRDEIRARVDDIAKRIENLVVHTKRASYVLQILLVLIAIALAIASYVISSRTPLPKGVEFFSSAITMFITALSAIVILGSVLYLNTTILFLPLLSALISVQSLVHIVATPSKPQPLLYIGAVAALLSLALFTKMISSGFSSYRSVLMAMIEIERSIESIAMAITQTEQRKPVLEQSIKRLFMKRYGARGEELAKYVEEMTRFRT